MKTATAKSTAKRTAATKKTAATSPATLPTPLPTATATIISRDVETFPSHRTTYLCNIAGRLVRVGVVEDSHGEMVVGLRGDASGKDFRAAKLAVERELAESRSPGATARQAAALTPAKLGIQG